MGSVVYDFLSESFLFSPSHQDNCYALFSEADLRKELESYRLHAIKSIKDLGDEISGYKSQLKIFGAQDYFSISHLMQTALYLDQVVLPDPIFPFTANRSDMSKNLGQMIGVAQSEGIDRPGLSAAARQMKELTPMIVANYLKFFPVSYYMEPDENIPLSYSKSGYSDVLPSSILSKYANSAVVRSLMKTDKGLIVQNVLEVGRGIAVRFKDDIEENVDIYNLFVQKVINMDNETQVVQFQMTLPDELPSTNEFEAWVNQSINQSAIEHYNQLLKGMVLSERFGASYLTGSKFTHSILGSNSSDNDVKSHVSDCILNLNLPFLENITMQDLMSVRMNDGEAFELFRKELESKFRELRTETDPGDLNIKIQNVVHELNEVQMVKIDQQMKSIRKKALSQTALAVGGLAGTVVTSGLSVAATVIALANGSNSYLEHRASLRENPAYFLWKAKNKA